LHPTMSSSNTPGANLIPKAGRKGGSGITLKLRQKNPYGKLLKGQWPARDDVISALKRGPSAIHQWQRAQTAELIIPHLNGEQIQSLIDKLGFPPSLLFSRIYDKLLAEFLGNTLNALSSSTGASDPGNNVNRDKLLSILRHSLRFIRIEQFKQLNIELLSRLDVVPKPILRLLSDHKNQDLMPSFPMNIRRQIWMFKLALFDREFYDVLWTEYVSSRCNDDGSLYLDGIMTFDGIHDDHYIELNKIKRANNDALKRTVDDIGDFEVLLKRCFENIEKKYLEALSSHTAAEPKWTELISLCNLRVDISCSLYDHAHQHLVAKHDRIWKLVHSLYFADSRRLQRNEGRNVLDMAAIELFHRELNDRKLTVEVSMLLSIPYLKGVLFNSAVHILEDIATKQMLPRDSKTLSVLSQILHIAAAPFSWFRANKKHIMSHRENPRGTATSSISSTSTSIKTLRSGLINPAIPKADHLVLFQFMPALTEAIHCDALGLDVQDLEQHDVGRLTVDILKKCAKSAVCCHILVYYLLYLLQKKRVHRCVELVDNAMKVPLDCGHLFAMNGLTEIHLVVTAVLKLNGENKLAANQKLQFVRFLICFNSARDEKVADTIRRLMDNVGMSQEDYDKTSRQLNGR